MARFNTVDSWFRDTAWFDYGTSEGAKKRALRRTAMNSPQAHAERAQRREKAENRAGYKASMARQAQKSAGELKWFWNAGKIGTR